MDDDNTRRAFLKWLGLGTGAAAVGGLGSACSDTAGAGARDAGDTGRTERRDTGKIRDATDSDTGVAGDARPESDAETGPDTRDAADSGGDLEDGGECRATGDDIQGPFYESGAPERNQLAPDDEPGRRIIIEGTVYGPDCRTPVEGALLDVWHANDEGDYYDASDDYRLRGQLQTDSDGSYEIYTIKPGRYRTSAGLRPAHVHFTISSPEHGSLTTQMYFAGDPQLGDDDSCGSCASDDPTLIVDFQPEQRNGTEILVGTFDIVLGA